MLINIKNTIGSISKKITINIELSFFEDDPTIIAPETLNGPVMPIKKKRGRPCLKKKREVADKAKAKKEQ